MNADGMSSRPEPAAARDSARGRRASRSAVPFQLTAACGSLNRWPAPCSATCRARWKTSASRTARSRAQYPPRPGTALVLVRYRGEAVVYDARFPVARPRRLRQTPALRRLAAETRLHPADLILPLFVREGLVEPRAIRSMPG